MPKIIRSEAMCRAVIDDLLKDPSLTDATLARRYKCSVSTIKNIRYNGPVQSRNKIININWRNDEQRRKR